MCNLAGVGLTALLLGWHVDSASQHDPAVYALFCFGHEKRLALTAIAEGAGSMLVMFILIPVR